MKKNTVVFVCFLLFVSCLCSCTTQSKGGFTVSIAYKNADKMIPQNYDYTLRDSVVPAGPVHVYLEEIPYGGDMHPVLLDSSVLKGKDGQLELKGNGKEEGIYQLIVEKGPVVLVINDVEKIAINLDLSKKDNYYTVSGSEASEHLKSFINQYDEKASVINKVLAETDSLKQFGGSDSLLAVSYTHLYNILIDPQGKVIAESLRGPDLENKLQEVLQ